VKILPLFLLPTLLLGCEKYHELFTKKGEEITLVCEGKQSRLNSNFKYIEKEQEIERTYHLKSEGKDSRWEVDVDGGKVKYDTRLHSNSTDADLINITVTPQTVSIFQSGVTQEGNDQTTIEINRSSGVWRYQYEMRVNNSLNFIYKDLLEGKCKELNKDSS
jgi:hypothetical protein